MNNPEHKVGDYVRIRDRLSTHDGQIGVISHVGTYAYWVLTDDGTDLPYWSVERVEACGNSEQRNATPRVTGVVSYNYMTGEIDTE